MDGKERREIIRAINPEKYGPIIDMIEAGICPYCKKKADEAAFSSEKSRAEFMDTGMCQACYDTIGKVLREYWESLSDNNKMNLGKAIVTNAILERDGDENDKA